MATSKMKITVEAEVAKANAELQKINSSIEKMKATQEKTNKVFNNFLAGGKVVAAAAVAVKAIQKVVDVSKQLIALHEAQIVAETRLEGALIASGNAIGYTTGELKRMAKEFQSVVTYNDELIMGAQGTILTFQNIGKNVFPDVVKASLDVSAALGRDVTSSAQLLGKALNDPITGMKSLKELGISLSADKQVLIKKLTEENNIYEAQKILMDEINNRYDGMAERIGALDVNKISSIKSTLDDIGANLGKVLTIKLSPILDWVDKKLGEIGEKAEMEAAKVSGDFSAISLDKLNAEVASIDEQIKAIQKGTSPNWIPSAKGPSPASNLILTAEQISKINILENQKIPILQAIADEEERVAHALADQAKAEADLARQQKAGGPYDASQEKYAQNAAGFHAGTGDTSTTTVATHYETALDLARDANIVFIKALEDANKIIDEHYQAILQDIEAGQYLGEVEKEQLSFAKTALEEQMALNKEQLSILRGENVEYEEALAFIKENNGLLNQSLGFKLSSLEAEIEAGREKLNNVSLSETEKKQIEEIVRLKEDALAKEKEASKEINIFLEENKALITQSTEERLKELEVLKKQALLQLEQKDLTEEQIKNLKKIISSIDAEVDGYKTVKSWVDVINEAINETKPKGWDDFLNNLQGSIDMFQDVTAGLTSSIKGLISSSMDLLENETKKKVQTIKGELDDLVKENDIARRAMDDREKESLDALQQQYNADAISYEEYQSRKAEIDAELTAERNRLADEEQTKQDEINRLENDLAKKKFEADKRNNIANAVMNGALAAVKALADLGPLAGSIAAAMIVGITAGQVANIAQQTFVPALKDGGVALSPKLVQIGDGDEPEAVLPLSKAKDFGFGTETKEPTQVINVVVENNTIYGIDDFGKKAYDAIISAQRVGKVPKKPF